MNEYALRLACALVRDWAGLRLYAFPSNGSPLAHAAMSARWGYEPAEQLLDRLPPNVQALSGDPWAIGYGSHGQHITPATAWSREVADANLEAHLEGSLTVARQLVRSPMSPWEAAALASYGYTGDVNDGEPLDGSELVRRLVRGDRRLAADCFNDWHVAPSKPIDGHVSRRLAEHEMFRGAHRLIHQLRTPL